MSTYLDTAKDEIKTWENNKPGFVADVASFILKPAEKAASALIPNAVQKAVNVSVESFLVGAGKSSELTFSPDAITKKRSHQLGRLRKLEKKLKICDELAAGYWKWNVTYAIGEGGATGATGLVGLAADIPALLTLTMRQIKQIGLCYGYDPVEPSEKEYALQVLRMGSGATVKDKVGFLIVLKQTEQVLLKQTWKKMSADLAAKKISHGAALAATKQFAKSLGIQLTKRKALQMVPVVGGLVGASFNGIYLNDVGRAAYMNYRRRFIQENEKTLFPSS